MSATRARAPRLVDRPNGDVWAVQQRGGVDHCIAHARRNPKGTGWEVRWVRDPRLPAVYPDRQAARQALAEMTGATP